MNLLTVDDHALFREGLCTLLANISPGVSIREAGCVEDAITECRAANFRMVLLDLSLPTSQGLGTLNAFREAVPEVPVIVVSGDDDKQNITGAIDLGAVGFIPKAHTSKLMIAALHFVLAGGIYLPPNLLHEHSGTESSAAATTEVVAAAYARLSARQQEVATLLLQGKSNKVIARNLDISEGTVKAHVSAIFQILGAKSRVEAVIIAAKSGIKVL